MKSIIDKVTLFNPTRLMSPISKAERFAIGHSYFFGFARFIVLTGTSRSFKVSNREMLEFRRKKFQKRSLLDF